MTVTAVLVDDHPLYRDGLRAALTRPDSDVTVLGEAADGSTGLERITDLQPDVALVDLRLPGLDGTALTRLIRRRLPGVQVLILTGLDDDDAIAEALDAGAAGVLKKDASASQIVAAVHAVARGAGFFDPNAARLLLARLNRAKLGSANKTASLSERELEVLRELAAGRTNREIAKHLVLSVRTVDNHVHSIYAKLSVHDRAQAALQAVRLGLIPLGQPAAF